MLEIFLKLANSHYVIKTLIFLAILLSPFVGQAQDSDPIDGSSKHHIYFNPGALISIPSGVQVGYEYNVLQKLHVDVQGGILVFSKTPNFNDFAATDRRGMRFQASIKTFLGPHFFLGPMALYKRVKMNERMWIGRFDDSFQQLVDLARVRQTVAGGLELGWEHQYEDSPLLLEITYGIGLQNFRVSYSNLPEDASLERIRGIGVRPGIFRYPFMNFSVKMKSPLSAFASDKKQKKNRSRK